MTQEVERHSRDRQIQLSRKIASRRKIYLDLRFWIILRDAALGIREDDKSQLLLRLLRHGVKAGALLCPISAAIFFELMKQPFVPERRIATASLADELSMGVSLMRQDRIQATEIASFMIAASGSEGLHDMQELVWTKAAYVLGDVYPVPKGVPAETVIEMQIMFFDLLWTMRLSDMVEQIGDHPGGPDPWHEVTAETNAKCRQFAHEITSYKAAYDIELRGIAEELGSIAADILAQRAAIEVGREPTAEERSRLDNVGRNAIYYGMRRPEFRRVMRSVHVGAAIHASMRWDKDRRFKPNDWYDFQHAYGAVGYCDVFLTERSLHHLLSRPQVDLKGISDCVIVSNIDEANAVIQSLVTEAADQAG